MTITADTRLYVRHRANWACEYCGVTETDTAGELTVDHYQPQARGGTDEPSNLVYCCARCNQYKVDYWPTREDEQPLWNPRTDSASIHFLHIEDGSLYALTRVGSFTLRRLRLNRAPLIAYRRRQHLQADEQRLLMRYRELVKLLNRLQAQHLSLLQEQQHLLDEQRRLIRRLLDEDV